jgi:DNA-3-methyladenine glycosylase I
MSDWLRVGTDGNVRCWWCGDDPLYVTYHDDEWGRRVTNDTRLFEKLCLEGFQSGLSWLTILRKRDNFRAAFADFDVHAVAAFDEGDVQRLLGDAGIVRHRGKIQSTINNAQRALELIETEGSIAAYVDRYRPSSERVVTSDSMPVASTSPESIALSKDLKKRGWSFVGPTTVYAFMQAMGLVNDHIEGCWVYDRSG